MRTWTKRLDGREPFYDRVPARDAPRPERQEGRDHRRQAGRDRRDASVTPVTNSVSNDCRAQPEPMVERERDTGDDRDDLGQLSSCFWSGVFSDSVFASMSAMWPISAPCRSR